MPALFFTFALAQLAPPELSWAPQYQNYIRNTERTPWFQNYAAPVLPEPFPELSWQPDYADFARVALGSAEFPAFHGPEEEVVPPFELDWGPEYPDSAPEAPRAIEYKAYFSDVGDVAAPDSAPDLVDVAYPDLIARDEVHASTVPSFFSRIDAFTKPDIVVSTALILPGVQIQYQAATAPIEVPAVAVPDFFAPEYPNFNRRRERAQAQFLFEPVQFVAALAPELSWEPEFPAFARIARIFPRVSEFPAFHGPEEEVVLPFELSWEPEYPDFARDAQRTAEFPAFFWHPNTPPILFADINWLSIHDDFARGRELHASQIPAFFGEFDVPHIPPPELAWEPEFPDFARETQRTSWFQYAADPTLFEPFEELSWEPEYRDFSRTRQRSTEFPAFFWHPNTPTVALADTGWLPSYPDLARGRAIHASQIQSLFGELAVPEIPPPELSWEPEFTDVAQAAKPAAGGPAFFGPEKEIVLEFFLDWDPDYPDFARAPTTRTPWFQEIARPVALELPALSWAPEYPNFPGRSAPRTTEHLFAKNVVAAADPDAPLLSWEADYPGFARAPARVVWFQDYVLLESPVATPVAARTITVAAENRTITVAAENRTITVKK